MTAHTHKPWYLKASSEKARESEDRSGRQGRKHKAPAQQAHPTVEQREQDMVRGGLCSPLQDFREEQELEQSRLLGVGGWAYLLLTYGDQGTSVLFQVSQNKQWQGSYIRLVPGSTNRRLSEMRSTLGGSDPPKLQ